MEEKILQPIIRECSSLYYSVVRSAEHGPKTEDIKQYILEVQQHLAHVTTVLDDIDQLMQVLDVFGDSWPPLRRNEKGGALVVDELLEIHSAFDSIRKRLFPGRGRRGPGPRHVFIRHFCRLWYLRTQNFPQVTRYSGGNCKGPFYNLIVDIGGKVDVWNPVHRAGSRGGAKRRGLPRHASSGIFAAELTPGFVAIFDAISIIITIFDLYE